MKRREQAALLLRKAARDEALLSDLGVRFEKTHDLGLLARLLAQCGRRLPEELDDLDALTPFGAVYRYEDFDSELPLDRQRAREALRFLGLWVESRIQERVPRRE